MKKIFSPQNLKIIFGTILIIVGVILAVNISGINIFSSLMGYLSVPTQKLFNNTFSTVYDTTNQKSREELIEENEKLQKKLNNMIALTVDYYDLKRENEQNSKYLELKKRNNDYKFASAKVVSRSPAELFYGFTIDQGSLVDIEVNDPVITEKGLVGIVSEVYPTYSKVKTILSSDVRVGAVDQTSKDRGVTMGNIIYADKGVLSLNYIASQNKVKKGDIIITSGIGGVYPGKLPIGEIKKIAQEPNSADIDIIIKPYEEIREVSNVFIITDFLGQGDTAFDFDE